MHLRFLAAEILNIYRALGAWESRRFFSLILPVREIRLTRSGGILWGNNWLHSWSWQQGYAFYKHRTFPEDWGRDRIHAMTWGKSISTRRQTSWPSPGLPSTRKIWTYWIESSKGPRRWLRDLHSSHRTRDWEPGLLACKREGSSRSCQSA